MNDLLKLALGGHGGLDRWKKVQAIKVGASITGAIWYVKSKGDFLQNVVLTAETRKERLTVDFPGQDKRAIFEPDRVTTASFFRRSSSFSCRAGLRSAPPSPPHEHPGFL